MAKRFMIGDEGFFARLHGVEFSESWKGLQQSDISHELVLSIPNAVNIVF